MFRTDLQKPSLQYRVRLGQALDVTCQLECGDHIFVGKYLRKQDRTLNITSTSRPYHAVVNGSGYKKEVAKLTWTIPRVTEEMLGDWYCIGGGLSSLSNQTFTITLESKCGDIPFVPHLLLEQHTVMLLIFFVLFVTYHVNVLAVI